VTTVIRPSIVRIGGVPGPSGGSGPPGAGAYTTLLADYTVPTALQNVTVNVASTAWLAVGGLVYIATAGYYAVVTIVDPTHVTLQNAGYGGNATVGTIIAHPQGVMAAGAQGPSGTASGLPLIPSTPGFYILDVVSGPIGSWVNPTLDMIGAALSITSFAGAQTVECGATITNPSFTAAYSSLPTSSTVTNTDAVDSPHNLTTPFTGVTLSGSFSKSTVNATTTFTLTAVAATTKTAAVNFTWEARSFGGIGTAGATSSTASGNNATLVGATGTLTGPLSASVIGQSFGPYSPTAQKIYLQVPHTSTPHTFKDQNGFGFVMNAPTTFNFTNQLGAVISMDLYESNILLSTPFTVSVST
jgi:hypothetical protein